MLVNIFSDLNKQLRACDRPEIKHTYDVWHFVKVSYVLN